jgi:hypothetical protein
MRLVLAAAAAAVVMLSVPTAPVEASGLSNMHAQVKVGRKICMKTHEHFGESGGGFPTKAMAQAAAARPWVSWTGFEYGREWANFRIAMGKRWNCRSGMTARGVSWSCSVYARPCRY